MASYRQVFYQIIFGTKYRKPTIAEDHCKELYKYIWGVITNKHCKLLRINGIEDHIHIFSDLHPSIALADYVKDIKVASSIWMKESGKFPEFEGWQDGYGAFTYSIRERDMIINYVKKQKQHHKKETFYDEYKRLLIENDVEFDERYFFVAVRIVHAAGGVPCCPGSLAELHSGLLPQLRRQGVSLSCSQVLPRVTLGLSLSCTQGYRN